MPNKIDGENNSINTHSPESIKQVVISVVVCTYNRADLLSDALQALVNQALDLCYYEVIVVDNNSSDNTRIVSEQFCSLYSNMRYFLERRQGVAYARNCGWQNANGEYIAYMDDDCKPPQQWLSIAIDIINRVSPAVFGGPINAFYKTPKPKWYKDSYGSHEIGKNAQILGKKECVNLGFGGNMFVKKDVLQFVGGFNTKFGMSGNKIAYGEEVDLIKLIVKNMPSQIMYYDPRLYMYHYVKPERMFLHKIACRYFAHGRYDYYTYDHKRKNIKHRAIGRLKLLVKTIIIIKAFAFDLLHGLFFRDKKLYPYMQNYLKECSFKQLRRLGVVYEEFLQLK